MAETPINLQLTRERLPIVDGWVAVPECAGLGITLDDEILARYAVGAKPLARGSVNPQRYNVREFNSRRSPVFARRGMIATAHPLASLAGMRMLLAGGNAFDAAVAAAAVLGVVEPYQTGLGGDAFALLYLAGERRVRALNASGPAPAAATLEVVSRARPRRPCRATARSPGPCPAASTAGRRCWPRTAACTLREALQPAIEYAEEGFPVAPGDALSCELNEALLRRDPEAARTLLIEGRAPRAGEVLVQPRSRADAPPRRRRRPRRVLRR